MEHESVYQTFDESQFIARFISEDFDSDAASDKFIQTIIENIKFFSRKNKTDLINIFSQFSAETRCLLHRCLADYVLDFYVLKEKFKAKNRTRDSTVIEDIYTFIHVLCATDEQIQSYDFSKIFRKSDNLNKSSNSQTHVNKNLDNAKLSNILNEIMNLKNLLNNQNTLLIKIQIENKNLKEEMIKIRDNQELKRNQTSQINNFTVPKAPLTPSSNIASSQVFTFNSQSQPQTPNRNLFSFSQALTGTTASSTSSSNKRPHNDHQINQSAKKPTITNISKPRPTLKNFNSFEPNNPITEIDLISNDNFTTVTKKPNKKKNNSYTKNLGRDESNLLKTNSKQFYIYLGRIDTNESTENVKKYLELKLKSVQINNSVREIKFSNLKELNADKPDRSYKSFTFSVGYLDKDIIEKKELWPLYSVVNKYKMPYAEWLVMSEKFKLRKTSNPPNQTTAAISQNV